MNSRSCILTLCLVLFAQVWAATENQGWQNNAMRGADGTINIDDPGEANDYEYSADGRDDEIDDYWDERDNEGDRERGSGFGADDEDDIEGGSADVLSPCQKLRDELNGKKLIGAYIPKCTLFGEFLPKQCHGSTGECWCVNRVGQQIPGTMRRAPEEPNCDDIDRETEIPQPPGPNRGGENKPVYPEEPETDRPGQPTDPDVVIDAPSPENEDKFNKGDAGVEIINNNDDDGEGVETKESVYNKVSRSSIIEQPGILAGIIGGAVVGLLCAVLLVMFIVYRMRKKDEGSYALDEPKRHVSPSITYSRARDKEFFA